MKTFKIRIQKLDNFSLTMLKTRLFSCGDHCGWIMKMALMKNIVQWFRKETKVFERKKMGYCESENHFRGNKDTSCCFNGEENTIGKVSPAVHSFSIKYKEKQKKEQRNESDLLLKHNSKNFSQWNVTFDTLVHYFTNPKKIQQEIKLQITRFPLFFYRIQKLRMPHNLHHL